MSTYRIEIDTEAGGVLPRGVFVRLEALGAWDRDLLVRLARRRWLRVGYVFGLAPGSHRGVWRMRGWGARGGVFARIGDPFTGLRWVPTRRSLTLLCHWKVREDEF